MSKKTLHFVVVFVLATIVAAAGILFFANTALKPAGTNVGAVKIVKAIDLSGKWESTVSKTGATFSAEIKDNTVLVEMSANDGFSGLWYGTFDILQPGQNLITSKFIDDPEHFVLSSAKTKDFIYDKESLVFDFSVMGTRTTVEMKRV